LFFADADYQNCLVEQPIHDVARAPFCVLDAEVDQLRLAVYLNQERRQFPEPAIVRIDQIGVLAIVKNLLGTIGRVAIELVVEIEVVECVLCHRHHAGPLVFLARLLRHCLGIALCRGLANFKRRPLCRVFAGILKGQPRDKARGIGDEPENVGSPVRGNDQVGFKTRLNRLHDQQRRFIQAGAGEDRGNLPAAGIADLGLAFEVFASLQLDCADAQRSADHDRHSLAEDIDHPAVRAGRGRGDSGLPLTGDLRRTDRGGIQFRVRGSPVLRNLRAFVRRSAGG